MSKFENRLNLLIPIPCQSDCPLFVFLPGMDGTGQLYQKQAESLAEYFDLRCLTIPPDDLSNWDALSSKVVSLLKQEHQQKSASSDSHSAIYLCGESFGGCLALKVALDAPELFEKIILVNSASSFNQRPWLSWGINFTQWIPDFVHKESALGLLPFLANLERIAVKERRALLAAMQSLPRATVSWRLSLLRDFCVKAEDLQRLIQPVLLMASTGDRLLPSVEEAQRLVNYLPNAQMVILPDSGHACLAEQKINLDKILKANHFLPTDVSKKALQAVA